jgi:tetratricopeptide (TPR) repeat protein
MKHAIVTMWLVFFLFGNVFSGQEEVCAAQLSDDQTAKARGVAHYIMGVNYDLMGLTSDALQEYQESAKNDAISFAPHLRLGVAYAHEGRYREAVIELSRAVAVDPEDMQAHYYLALVYSSLHDYAKAAEQYEKILKKLSLEEPKNAELFSYLGQLYFSQGQEEKAIEQFEKVLKIDPKNTGAMLTVALYYLDHGRRKDAVPLLEKCAVQDPMDDACLNSLSYIYAEDNVNIDEAYRLVQNALKIDPENPAYLDTLGWVLYRKGLYNESLKELGRAEALIVDPTIYSHIADVYLKLNQPDLAKKYWNLSLQADPEQPDIKSKLGGLDQGLPQHSKKQD